MRSHFALTLALTLPALAPVPIAHVPTTVVERYASGALRSRVTVVSGEPNGLTERWYEDGRPSSREWYWHGEKTGLHESWWPNGHLRVQAHYLRDTYQGEYRTWYASGRPYELRHFDLGHESGLEQSWTEDGTLFLNYEVRNGRRYGLINARPCLPAGADGYSTEVQR